MFCPLLFRRIPLGLPMAILAALWLTFPTDSQGLDTQKKEGQHPVDFLVQFHHQAHPEQVLKGMGLSPWRPESTPFGVHFVSADKELGDADKVLLLRELQQHPYVHTAQLNHVIQRRGWTDDPWVTAQWHHVQDSDIDLDSDSAWAISTGGTNPLGHQPVVAIIEGFDPDHPELEDNVAVNAEDIPNNLIDDDENGYVDDHLGWNPWTMTDVVSQDDHGTAVAGMAGAASGNAFQGAGVAPDAGLMRIDIGPLTEAEVIAAYAYARDRRKRFNESQGASGAFVVATNASWGIDYANPEDHPLWCAVYDSLLEVGILNVAATANLSIDVDLVGDMPTGCGSIGLLSVTATDSMDLRSQAAFGLNSIDLGAPGEQLLLPTGWSSPADSSMALWTGTSFASPAVAGAIALLYGAPCPEFAGQALAHPHLAALRVRDALLEGVDACPDLLDVTTTGGRLNLHGALSELMSGCADVDSIGCTQPGACNYDVFAVVDDGTCDTLSCYGCTHPAACNFDPLVSLNDGSCTHPEPGYDCAGQCLWQTQWAAPLAGGAWTSLSFQAAGACSGATVELDFQSNGGAWASDQILVLESPSGQGVQLTGLYPINPAALEDAPLANNVTFSGSSPLNWATNAPGNFSTNVNGINLSGNGIWTLHATNLWSGTEGSEMGWHVALVGLCPFPVTLCTLDLDADGWVGITDVIALLSSWGCLVDCPGDITGDGTVTASDLTLLLTGFGESCN